MFIRDWTMCLECDNHSRLNSEHNWAEEEPIRQFNQHKNLHFDNERDVHMSSQKHEESGHKLESDLLATS